MSDPKSKRVGDYLAKADGWARDRQDDLIASRRIAWIVAAAAAVVAVCEALALLFLMPLKRVEPYTLMVDRQTGFVQLLKPLDPSLVSADAALTQSFLVQYVIAREGFDIDSVQNDYRKVAVWSGGEARSKFLATMPASNPDSPLARYPRSTVIDVRVKSVTSLGEHVAMVRFETSRRDAGQQDGATRAFVAVIRYGYVNQPMSTAARYLNPLGFQVGRYRRSAEMLQTTDAVPSPFNASGPPPSASRGPAAYTAVPSPRP